MNESATNRFQAFKVASVMVDRIIKDIYGDRYDTEKTAEGEIDESVKSAEEFIDWVYESCK